MLLAKFHAGIRKSLPDFWLPPLEQPIKFVLISIFIPDVALFNSGLMLSPLYFRDSDNGNCLYNSCSIALTGSEKLTHILRALTSIELFTNTNYFAFYPHFREVFDALGENRSGG